MGTAGLDEGMLVQDTVFCELFTREVTDSRRHGQPLYGFYYKIFGNGQAYAMAILNGEAGRAVRTSGAPTRLPLRGARASRSSGGWWECGAWARLWTTERWRVTTPTSR